MKLIEKTLKSNIIYEGKVIIVNCDDVILPNDNIAKREIVHHRGGVAVLAIEDGHAYMVRQFRYAYGKELLEIPAGKLEKGEEPYSAALRELEEEVGLKASKLISLGQIYPTVGYCDEIIYLYLALDFTKSQASLDEDEFLNVFKMKLEDLYQMISDNKISDAKTIISLLKYKGGDYDAKKANK